MLINPFIGKRSRFKILGKVYKFEKRKKVYTIR
jgi:hypothetical protein